MSQRQENSGDPDREERIRHLPGRDVQERHFSLFTAYLESSLADSLYSCPALINAS